MVVLFSLLWDSFPDLSALDFKAIGAAEIDDLIAPASVTLEDFLKGEFQPSSSATKALPKAQRIPTHEIDEDDLVLSSSPPPIALFSASFLAETSNDDEEAIVDCSKEAGLL